MAHSADVVCEDHGSIIMFQPLSESARLFFKEDVQSEAWQWMGNGLCLDRRAALQFREILIDNGFSLV